MNIAKGIEVLAVCRAGGFEPAFLHARTEPGVDLDTGCDRVPKAGEQTGQGLGGALGAGRDEQVVISRQTSPYLDRGANSISGEPVTVGVCVPPQFDCLCHPRVILISNPWVPAELLDRLDLALAVQVKGEQLAARLLGLSGDLRPGRRKIMALIPGGGKVAASQVSRSLRPAQRGDRGPDFVVRRRRPVIFVDVATVLRLVQLAVFAVLADSGRKGAVGVDADRYKTGLQAPIKSAVGSRDGLVRGDRLHPRLGAGRPIPHAGHHRTGADESGAEQGAAKDSNDRSPGVWQPNVHALPPELSSGSGPWLCPSGGSGQLRNG